MLRNLSHRLMLKTHIEGILHIPCKIVTALLLVLLGASLPTAAQAPEQPCDTLILTDKRVMSVIIDSTNAEAVWFHLCADSTARPRMIPRRYILETRSRRTPSEAGPVENGPLDLHPSPGSGIKTWIFSKPGTKEIVLRPGTKIVVTVLDQGRPTRYNGYLLDLDSLQLRMETTNGQILYVDKSATTKIKIPSKNSKWLAGLGLILLLVSALVTFIGLLLLLAPNSPGQREEIVKGGCLQFSLLGLVAAGVGLIMASQPHVLEAPFGGPWTVVENLPPTEALHEPKERLPEP